MCCCGFIKKGLIVDLLCILDISSVSLSSNTQKLSSSSGVWLVCSLDEVEKELRRIKSGKFSGQLFVVMQEFRLTDC